MTVLLKIVLPSVLFASMEIAFSNETYESLVPLTWDCECTEKHTCYIETKFPNENRIINVITARVAKITSP